MAEPRSVLIIQTAFIGDVILATALVESVHRKFPSCSIDFLLRKGNESLLEDHPFIRHVKVFDKTRKYRNLYHLVRQIRNSRYDAVINVQRFATTGLLTVFSGSETTIGFDKNPLSRWFTTRVPHRLDGMHEVDRNHTLIRDWVGSERPRPRLYPSGHHMDRVRPYKSGPYVTISPASVWFTKQFPEARWGELIRGLPQGLTIYLLGALADYALCESLAKLVPEKKALSLAGQLSFLESAALMRDSVMNFVNDSAPMHLCSSVNGPVCAVYCSTVPAFGFGPLSDISHVIETPLKLSCRPCGLHGHRSCPEGHFKCATTIEIPRLLSTLGSS